MKKALLFLLSACMMISVMSCGAAEEKDYTEEFRQMYSADDYYEEQQQQIEALVKEYADQLQAVDTDKDKKADAKTAAAEQLKTEFEAKISEIDKKDMVDVKKSAEEFFDSVKTYVFPFEPFAKYKTTKHNEYDTVSLASSKAKAIKDLKKVVAGTSDSVNVKLYYNNMPFTVNIKCVMNSEGLPELVFKSDVPWSDVKMANNSFFGIDVFTMVNQDLDYSKLQETLFERVANQDTIHELNCRQFNILSSNVIKYINSIYHIKSQNCTYYIYADGCTGQTEFYTDDPSQAGFSYSEDGTELTVKAIDARHYDIINSEGSFTNTFGNTVSKDLSDYQKADFILIRINTFPAAIGANNEFTTAYYAIML